MATTVDVPRVTESTHEHAWSAALDRPVHADDRALVVEQAIEAVEKTARGTHVDLVTHAVHGDPETYLYSHLESEFGSRITVEYVRRSDDGGHVTRAHVGGR